MYGGQGNGVRKFLEAHGAGSAFYAPAPLNISRNKFINKVEAEHSSRRAADEKIAEDHQRWLTAGRQKCSNCTLSINRVQRRIIYKRGSNAKTSYLHFNCFPGNPCLGHA